MREPSTRITSRSGSTRRPCSRTTSDIHLDPTLVDHDFARPARGDSGLGQHLLQADARCRFGHGGGSGIRVWRSLFRHQVQCVRKLAAASASWPSSASSSSTSGRCGASGGRSSSVRMPIRSKK